MNEIFAAREPSAAPPPTVRPAPFEFSGPQEALFTSLSKLSASWEAPPSYSACSLC